MGRDHPSQAKFCSECGTRLAPSSSPETPKHIAERILTSKSSIEGERKQITVLFADVKGSMELLADRDPEEARKILDPVLELMMDAVHRYEGTVNQVMGDGIMALFGAPIAHEDHAVRACYAALDMRDAIARHGAEILVRVGLHSGEVVVRSVGSDLRMDYTAVGQTTHLAARMEQTAAPGTIRATASTARLAEGFVMTASLGRLAIKGLSRDVDVHEVTGFGQATSRLHVAAARGLTAFVGRDVELRELESAVSSARAGRGQLVAVVGEPGVGKSRVCWELVNGVDPVEWRVLRSHALSYGKDRPNFSARQLLQDFFEGEREHGDDAAGAIARRLRAVDPALEPMLPAVLSMLDIPYDNPAWDALDPRHRRERTLETIRQLLVRGSVEAPLLVFIEDLQWIDGETQALLDCLVDSLVTARILLLVTFRPEYRHRWTGQTFFRHIGIDALPTDAAQNFLHHLAGDDPSLRPVTDSLIAHTQGNPFFLEESLQNLVETGALVGHRGAYRAVKPISGMVIAPSVQAVLAARIDRLDVAEKRLLQAAAVIGRDAPLPWLRAVTEDPDQLERQLAVLRAAEFIREVPSSSGTQYTFKHALTHDVAYGGVVGDRRRFLHGQLVDAIERLHADRAAQEHADTLAHHALAAERWDKAVDYLRASGTRAYATGGVAECLDRYEQGLRLLDRLGGSADDRRRAIDLHLEFHGPLFLLGEFDRLAQLSGQARTWAEAIGDRHRMGRASATLASCAGAHANYDAAIAYARFALDVADEVDDAELRIAASHLLGVCLEARGEYGSAVRFLEAVVDGNHADVAHRRLGLVLPPYIFDNGFLGIAHGFTGRFAAAKGHSLRAVRTADEYDHPGAQTFAYTLYASLLAMQGEFDEAGVWAERAVTLGERNGVFAFVSSARVVLGWVCAWTGRVAEGIEYLEQAIAFEEQVGLKMHAPTHYERLGEALMLGGDLQRAREIALKACTLAEELGEQGSRAEALRLLGDVARAAGDHAGASEHYDTAERMARELGMSPLIAHVYAGRAALAATAGHDAEWRRHSEQARMMYDEMGMRFWISTLDRAVTPSP